MSLSIHLQSAAMMINPLTLSLIVKWGFQKPPTPIRRIEHPAKFGKQAPRRSDKNIKGLKRLQPLTLSNLSKPLLARQVQDLSISENQRKYCSRCHLSSISTRKVPVRSTVTLAITPKPSSSETLPSYRARGAGTTKETSTSTTGGSRLITHSTTSIECYVLPDSVVGKMSVDSPRDHIAFFDTPCRSICSEVTS